MNIIRKILYSNKLTRRICEKRVYTRDILKKEKKRVYFTFVPEHENLGDHAIAFAIEKLLKDNEIPYSIVTDQTMYALKGKKLLHIFNKRPLLINGGGNMGTLWFHIETAYRATIKNNKKSNIIILPNTIFYEDGEYGKEELQKSQVIYNKHKDLKIYAREKLSYDYMQKVYNNVKLCPDMVLSLKKDENQGQRKGCLLCLRRDIEKTLTDKEYDLLLAQVEKTFGEEFAFTDTVLDEKFALENRNQKLQEKFDEFKRAELVITDRLHGMIFCAITGTPCIVLDSQSPKVKGCYEWIKNLEYIRFADDVEDIVKIYDAIPKKEHCYDNSHLQSYYDELAQDIKKMMKKR